MFAPRDKFGTKEFNECVAANDVLIMCKSNDKLIRFLSNDFFYSGALVHADGEGGGQGQAGEGDGGGGGEASQAGHPTHPSQAGEGEGEGQGDGEVEGQAGDGDGDGDDDGEAGQGQAQRNRTGSGAGHAQAPQAPQAAHAAQALARQAETQGVDEDQGEHERGRAGPRAKDDRTRARKRSRGVQGNPGERGMRREPKRSRLPAKERGPSAAMARARGTRGSSSAASEVKALRAQLQALKEASKGQLTALQARLEKEQANRPAAALKSMCSGMNLDELAAIVQRAGKDNAYPSVAILEEMGFASTVFGTQQVRDTAVKVLAASSYTPAGILRSVLLKVAKPDQELSSVLLAHVMAYIQQEAERCGWTPRQRAHLGGANALAATLSNKTISQWRTQQGGVTLECMQVWPIVRQALAVVFEQLHGYGGCALAPCAVLADVAAPLPVMSP